MEREPHRKRIENHVAALTLFGKKHTLAHRHQALTDIVNGSSPRRAQPSHKERTASFVRNKGLIIIYLKRTTRPLRENENHHQRIII